MAFETAQYIEQVRESSAKFQSHHDRDSSLRHRRFRFRFACMTSSRLLFSIHFSYDVITIGEEGGFDDDVIMTHLFL